MLLSKSHGIKCGYSHCELQRQLLAETQRGEP
jgi:hypothetical protein